jgi:hypothetical protein
LNRYTFVVQVHPDGISTLENLTTHERIPISDLAAVGPQIAEWLGSLADGDETRADSPGERVVPSSTEDSAIA